LQRRHDFVPPIEGVPRAVAKPVDEFRKVWPAALEVGEEVVPAGGVVVVVVVDTPPFCLLLLLDVVVLVVVRGFSASPSPEPRTSWMWSIVADFGSVLVQRTEWPGVEQIRGII